ncbi:MAG: NUDIX hydrolase [Anaeroplasma sp.]
MKLLFKMDEMDYELSWKSFKRPSSRGIYIKGNKIAMIHSIKYNYYKFPGGGIESGENPVQALIREVKEETGLIVNINTIKEYGYVHRIQKSKFKQNEVFEQDNYYYFIECEDNAISQKLDDYEKDEKFTLEFVDPLYAIKINREKKHDSIDRLMLERDAKVLELLVIHNFFNNSD